MRLTISQEAAIVWAIAALFVANLVVSVLMPGLGHWHDRPGDGYLANMIATVMGAYLLVWPLSFVSDGRIPTDGLLPLGFILWMMAVAAIVIVVAYARSMDVLHRFLLAFFVAIQVAGFGAVHWSTLGN